MLEGHTDYINAIAANTEPDSQLLASVSGMSAEWQLARLLLPI